MKKFQILLDNGSSSMTVMGNMTLKIKTKESEKTTWGTQARKFTTSKKVNVDFCLPEFIAMEIVTWKWHVDEYNNGKYDMLLGRDLLYQTGTRS